MSPDLTVGLVLLLGGAVIVIGVVFYAVATWLVELWEWARR